MLTDVLFCYKRQKILSYMFGKVWAISHFLIQLYLLNINSNNQLVSLSKLVDNSCSLVRTQICFCFARVISGNFILMDSEKVVTTSSTNQIEYPLGSKHTLSKFLLLTK